MKDTGQSLGGYGSGLKIRRASQDQRRLPSEASMLLLLGEGVSQEIALSVAG